MDERLKGKMYKTVEIRGSRWHWVLWRSQVARCLILWCVGDLVVFSYSDGTVWRWSLGHFSCGLSYSCPSLRHVMHNGMYDFKIGWFQHGGWSFMIWAAISWYSVGPIFYFMRPGASWSGWCFLTIMQVFKMTICPFTLPEMFSLGFRSVKMHFVFRDQ